MEAHACKNGWETRQLVVDHVLGLRKHPCFKSARTVLVAEANLGNEAQEVAETLLSTLDNCVVLCDRKEDYGVRTNPGMPQLYVRTLSSLIAKGGVGYHENLVCTNKFIKNKTRKERQKKSRQEFERQLRSFRRVPLLPKTLLSTPRYAYTGKADKDNQRSGTMRDDMVMALMMGIYYGDQLANGHVFVRGFEQRLATGESRRKQLAPYIDPSTRTSSLTDQAAGRVRARHRRVDRRVRAREDRKLARFNRPGDRDT